MIGHGKSIAARRLLVAGVLVLLAGCARCGGLSGRNPEEFLAPDATFVVSVPSLGRLADHSQSLLGTLRQGAGGSEAVKMSATLARQLGFDPLTKEGQKAAGLDSSRALAIGVTAGARSGAFAALPIGDQAKLEETILRLVRDRTGAGVKEQRSVGDATATVLSRSAGGPAALAYVVKDGFLLLAAGTDAPQVAVDASSRTAEQSLARHAPYLAAKEKVGAGDVVVFIPRSPTPAIALAPGGLAVAVNVTATEIATRAFVALGDESRQLSAALLAGGGETSLAHLPKGSPMYLRGGVNWSALAQEISKNEHGRSGLDQARALAKEAGIDFDAELLGNIEPSFAASVAISPNADLASALDFDPRRTNPFDNYVLVGLGQVKDGAKASATLEKLAEAGAQLGMQISTRDVAGTRVYTATDRLGERLSWAVQGRDLLVTGGLAERLAPTLEALKTKKTVLAASEFPARMRSALFNPNGVALSLDFARVGESVNSLQMPGGGPAAIIARSVVNSAIQPLSRLKFAAGVMPTDGGVLVDVAISAQ